jgi:hypothetical protein
MRVAKLIKLLALLIFNVRSSPIQLLSHRLWNRELEAVGRLACLSPGFGSARPRRQELGWAVLHCQKRQSTFSVAAQG